MRTQLIEGHIKELKRSLGFKQPVDDIKLYSLYQARDYYGMVSAMMTLMSIDLTVKVGLVNSGGRDVPAWINFPQPFPLFSTPQFKTTKVEMYLRKSFLTEVGFESTVMAISHELSHIILESTYSPLRTKEEAVDLTAMLLGFRDYYVTGSLVRGKESPYRIGYLTKDELSHAAWFMTYGTR